jgi:hypothetical protein
MRVAIATSRGRSASKSEVFIVLTSFLTFLDAQV